MRHLSDWVDGFVELAEALPSPTLFKKWAGIAAIAGALERKVWVRTLGMDLYPNLYTVLVAPPGVGKTIVTSLVEELWRELPDHHVAPKSLTTAAIIDSLFEAKRQKTVIGRTQLHLDFNSLLINSGELGVLIPTYDTAFMAVLTDIYDGRQYEERRRGKDIHITIKKPVLNILAACTPSYLNSMLPEGAWDQGFMSRTFLVYSGERILGELFAEETVSLQLKQRLQSDLAVIGNLVGKISFTEESMNAIVNWHKAGGPPAPDHPKLTHYLTRRTMHVLKLSMIASVSAGNSLTIEVEHFQRALDWLLEIEAEMPDIFKALGARGDGQVIEEAWHFLFNVYRARKEPIAEHRLVGFLSERVPSHKVLAIIDLMEKSGQIKREIGTKGQIGWKPQVKSY